MLNTDSSWHDLSLGDSVSWANQHNVEIHTEDTSGRIVLQTQIDVLSDTETKASSVGEVLLLQLIFLDLQSTIQDFVGLEATDLRRLLKRKWIG